MKTVPRTLLALAVTLLAIAAMLGAMQKANADAPHSAPANASQPSQALPAF